MSLKDLNKLFSSLETLTAMYWKVNPSIARKLSSVLTEIRCQKNLVQYYDTQPPQKSEEVL